jgi:hypothetical protein
MLLHLPIVLLATLSPIAVSDTVPKFDIVKECRFESLSSADFDRCRQDEGAALRELQQVWTQFVKHLFLNAPATPTPLCVPKT